jgi:hypothetical protein
MKTRYILLSLLAVSATLLAGPFVPYDSTKPPSLSLPVAYELAAKTLGTATNQFYCSGARLDTDFGKPMWSFTFSTTNTPPHFQSVWVYFDGTARLAPNVIL